ncbi:probable F-box protein At4g22030 [Neltuma alba]|uniref:probable F-box protein At4g22030 n=1 Tax=Neltuma alba TaxID=207710 RepID=UPI0010A504EF|nr:probable F-box protein At4g22030 [Prosopis alba]XP_028793506.1 probable F-box protein At4g22030 [Prosopis alba]
MSSLQISASSFCSSSSSSIKKVNAAINVPKLPRVRFPLPKVSPTTTTKLVKELKRSTGTIIPSQLDVTSTEIRDDDDYSCSSSNKSKATIQLYAILEAVSDRIEMHNNMGEQRNNWNSLLLNSVNMMTLSATTMVGLNTAIDNTAFRLSSTLLFTAATGMLLIMNRIQPSQLTEEQRNATKLFKRLQKEIQTTLAIGNPTEEDVQSAMEKVLALDKAYPLPLLGAMLEKFPSKFEPAVWWPKSKKTNDFQKQIARSHKKTNNGWTPELEMEMWQLLEVMKRKDMEDYDRLGNLALKINKTLATSGPLLTGIAALGSALASHGSSWPGIAAAMAGSMAASVNSLEHGGQVGMVFEMYRNCGGFFKLLQETIEATLEEKDCEKRENGEVFEMKVAMKLGRSVSQLRQVASKFVAYESEGMAMDEFASKLI